MSKAEADLEELHRAILAKAPLTAPIWFARLSKSILSLESLPHRCSLAEEADDLGIELRELLFGKRQGCYRILFTIQNQTVEVHHIRRAVRGRLQPDDLE
jgi:ParE toxin of type II toxin-antitoxin system, parDE